MSDISHLGTDVSTQCMHGACLVSHLALNGNFTVSELRVINHFRMYKGILFISDRCNHQCSHLHKSVEDADTTFNVIHDLDWPSRDHSTISEWGTWKKSIITLCDEIKFKLHAPLLEWTLDYNKYITYWQWFLSRDLHTLYYREHGTWWK